MLDSSAHVGLVPIDDGGDDQVEARCAILLGFMAAINDAPLPECVDRLRQCMALLAVVEAGMATPRSEEHTSELQSLMRISYAVFCLTKKKLTYKHHTNLLYLYQLDTSNTHNH